MANWLKQVTRTSNNRKIVFLLKEGLIMVKVINKSMDKKAFDKTISQLHQRKKLDAHKFCGVIKLKEDPVSIQKKMRNEWR
jgi:hypothetical protein